MAGPLAPKLTALSLIAAAFVLVFSASLLTAMYSRDKYAVTVNEMKYRWDISFHAKVVPIGNSGCKVRLSTPDAPSSFAGVMAEPFRLTKFEISYACPSRTQHMVRCEGPDGQVAFGEEAHFNYTQTGTQIFKLSLCALEESQDTKEDEGRELMTKKSQNNGWCKSPSGSQDVDIPLTVVYVRKEIRNMDPEERNTFFNVMKLMANVTTEEGRRIYGEKYISYQELVAKHAATVYHTPGECDYGHFGPAFITYHRAYIMEFERAVQAINPMLSVPYWDHLSDAGAYEDINKSPVFGPEFFGSSHGDPNDHYIVKDGPFAYWPVPYGDEAEMWAKKTWRGLGPSNMISPYGFLRGKDNMAKAPYLTRIAGTTMPLATLKDWDKCRDLPIVGSYVACLDFSSTHPWPHLVIGGMSGKPSFSDLEGILNCSGIPSGACPETFQVISARATAFRTTQIFDGCLICDKKCTSLAQDPETCSCECSQERPRCDPEQIFIRTLKKFYLEGTMPPFMESKLAWAEYGLCAKDQYYGDMFDLAIASLDPIFWPHHTNVDRLTVSWRKIHKGAWEDLGFTYPSKDNSRYPDYLSPNNILSSNEMWKSVFSPGNRNPSGSCPGHGLWDPVLKGAFHSIFRGLPENESYTNLQVLETFDFEIHAPEVADYIYDKYET